MQFSLNVSRTQEMTVALWRQKRGGQPPIHTGGAEVEKVTSFIFVGVHIREYLSCYLEHRTQTHRLVPVCHRASVEGLHDSVVRELR